MAAIIHQEFLIYCYGLWAWTGPRIIYFVE